MLRATRTARWPLFLVVGVVVLGGLVIASAFSWLLGGIAYGWWDPSHLSTTPDVGVSFLEPVKIALTIAAGIGAAVALVVAYRKQRLAERQEPREQYIAAVKQMGDANPTVRLAGVYALANLADDHPALAQQCIDVLCGHLRIPWEPPPPDHPAASRTVQQPGPGVDATTVWTHPATHGEQQVRETILRVIAGHLRKEPENDTLGVTLHLIVNRARGIRGWRPAGPWSSLSYDLTGAILPTHDFTRAVFAAEAVFDHVTFTTDAHFDRTVFRGRASFCDATYTGAGDFSYSRFEEGASFSRALFIGQASFEAARFGDGRFDGMTDFTAATFAADASFSSAFFWTSTSLDGATFSGEARFDLVHTYFAIQMIDVTFNGTVTGLNGFAYITEANKPLIHEG